MTLIVTCSTQKKLLNQCLNAQLWALGRDIHHQSGNLLIEYGMEKHESPYQAKGSNRYSFNREYLGFHIWAFGVWVHETGQPGILVKRFTGIPRIIFDQKKTLELWTPDSFVDGTSPLSRAKASEAYPLLHHLAEFFIHYESWIESNHGKTYRKQILNKNKKLKLKSGIIDSWRSFKDQVSQNLDEIIF